jgi:trk system potassium uptake protein TrkA
LGHNVTVIDKNAEALHSIEESIDVFALIGDVEISKTYQKLHEKEIDLFIAVTNLDNVNLVAVLMADSVLNIKKKFVRLQKYFLDGDIIKEKLGIDKIIFPLQLTSNSITSLLDYPKANNIKFFTYTDHKLLSIRVTQNLDIETLNIIGIERDRKFFVYKDTIQIQSDDLLYLFGSETYIRDICNRFDLQNRKIDRCVIFGAGELGVNIAKALLERGRNVKLVEKELSTCNIADEELCGKATVINAKYGIHDIFEDEALHNADIFIAATNNDEYNIIKCLEARDRGIKKVLAINNELEYYNLMHSLGIVVVRGPKVSATNNIIEEVGSTKVVIQKHFCGAKAAVLMRKISYTPHLLQKKVSPLKVKESLIFYMKDEQLYPFDKKILMSECDIIIAFCAINETSKVKQWLNEL